MFAWMLDDATPDEVRVVIGPLPLPVRLVYKAVWKPRYTKLPAGDRPGVRFADDRGQKPGSGHRFLATIMTHPAS